MSRKLFGSWGEGLDDVTFARALAAVGVLKSLPSYSSPIDDRALTQALVQRVPDGSAVRWLCPSLVFLQQNKPATAEKLAGQWERVVRGLQTKPRLQVMSGPAIWPAGLDLLWVLAQLQRPEIDAGSVYAATRVHEIAGWDWPLDVAVFADDSVDSAAKLRSSLHAAAARSEHVRELVSLSADDGDCDILLMPQNLPHAAAAVLRRANPARAGVVIVLGGEGAGGDAPALWEIVRSRTGASVVAVLSVPPKDVAQWWIALLAVLAHDTNVDVALTATAREAGLTVSIVGSPEFLTRARVSIAMRRLATRFVRSDALAKIELPSDVMYRSGLESRVSARTIGGWLTGHLPHADFKNEDRDARMTAQLGFALRSMELTPLAFDLLRPAPEVRREQRFISADVFDDAAKDRSREPQFFFRRDRTYRIEISIAARDVASIQPPSGEAFPDEQLPRDGEAHTLTVVMTEPRLLPEPMIGRITLPPVGRSTTATFRLSMRVPEGMDAPDTVEARVIVLFRNRVLQTAILSGAVLAGEATPREEHVIHMGVEAVVHPLNDLSSRRRFDGSLLVNHTTADKTPTLTYVRGDRVSYKIRDIAGIQQQIDIGLAAMHDSPEAFADGLTGEGTVTLLRQLAKHGSMLYQALIDTVGEDDLNRMERVQLLGMRPDARMPIEFAYDYPYPADEAPMCPNARAALAAGRCGDCPNAKASATFCPMGFWGLRKVIERHLFLPGGATGDDFEMKAAAVDERPMLDPLAGALFAASDRVDAVDPGGIESVRAKVAAVVHDAGLAPIPSWAAWQNEVSERPHGLHVLIVHSGERENVAIPTRYIEIGAGQQVDFGAIGKPYVNADRQRPKPIVLLVGCETARAKKEYETLIAQYRRAGAAIIIASGSYVLGRHAAPVVAALLDCLTELPMDGTQSFGEAMRSLRCRMLDRGVPMVLCLSTYGDADWRLSAVPAANRELTPV